MRRREGIVWTVLVALALCGTVAAGVWHQIEVGKREECRPLRGEAAWRCYRNVEEWTDRMLTWRNGLLAVLVLLGALFVLRVFVGWWMGSSNAARAKAAGWLLLLAAVAVNWDSRPGPAVFGGDAYTEIVARLHAIEGSANEIVSAAMVVASVICFCTSALLRDSEGGP